MSAAANVTRVYRNHTIDSKRWAGFVPRAGDVIVTTSYKSGTTWTLGILYRLRALRFGAPPPPGDYWLDARMFPVPLEQQLAELEAMAHPRVLKSHLAADGLPLWEGVRYVVVGRDPRDVFMSLVNHYDQFTDEAYAAFNDSPGREGPPLPRYDGDVQALWRSWISRGWFPWESEGWPWWGNMHHVATWWSLRGREDVLFLHFNDLKRDPAGQIRRLAEFTGQGASETEIAALVAGTTLDAMRRDAIDAGDPLAVMFRDGARGFFNRGTNGRWQGVLDDAALALYVRKRDEVLPPDCAAWLEQGGPVPA